MPSLHHLKRAIITHSNIWSFGMYSIAHKGPLNISPRVYYSAPTQETNHQYAFVVHSLLIALLYTCIVYVNVMLQNIVITFCPHLRVHALDMLTIQNNIYQRKLSSIIIHFVWGPFLIVSYADIVFRKWRKRYLKCRLDCAERITLRGRCNVHVPVCWVFQLR